mgnify:CR=1 FL=1
MSPFAWYRAYDPEGFPRVSGDEPCSRQTADGLILFSPRERG